MESTQNGQRPRVVAGSSPRIRPEHSSVSRSVGRRERRALETRVRLFRCALELFSQRGFSNVTVEDITEAADVGKGTFFNYFPSKDHVLGVMPEIQIGKVKEALALAKTGKQSVRGVMQRLFRNLAEEPGRSPDLARTVVTSFLASESVRILVRERMSEGRHLIAAIFAIGQRGREIDAQLDRENLALLMQQSILGTILLWSLRGEPSLRRAMENTFEHFWRGIAAKEGQAKR